MQQPNIVAKYKHANGAFGQLDGDNYLLSVCFDDKGESYFEYAKEDGSYYEKEKKGDEEDCRCWTVEMADHYVSEGYWKKVEVEDGNKG